MNALDLKHFIQKVGFDLGFSHIGIAPAQIDHSLNNKLNYWLKNGYQASMKWIANRAEERTNIYKYFPEVKSVISLTVNYFTGTSTDHMNNYKISNYAWGDDYHKTVKVKANTLLNQLKLVKPNIKGLVCVDTSPIMEKDWAQKAGIGWIGKHTNLITRDYGSWVFLCEILIDTEIEYDKPFIEDLCGTCTACLEACPTNAFPEPYILDASKCISYLTIEHRGEFDNNIVDNLYNWIYGCDICQNVCPWNIKFSQKSMTEEFQPRHEIIKKNRADWDLLTENEFKTLFKDSAIKRTKYVGLIRNINHHNN